MIPQYCRKNTLLMCLKYMYENVDLNVYYLYIGLYELPQKAFPCIYIKLTLSESPLLIKNAYLEKPALFNGTYQTIGKSQGTPRSHCFTTCSNSLKKTIAAES